jgi:hypothetical protein
VTPFNPLYDTPEGGACEHTDVTDNVCDDCGYEDFEGTTGQHGDTWERDVAVAFLIASLDVADIDASLSIEDSTDADISGTSVAIYLNYEGRRLALETYEALKAFKAFKDPQ